METIEGYNEAIREHFNGKRHGGIWYDDTSAVWNEVLRANGFVSVSWRNGDAGDPHVARRADGSEVALTDIEVQQMVVEHCKDCGK